MNSPYFNISMSNWINKTNDLISKHPLSHEDIVQTVLESWNSILITKIGNELQIGVDIFPSPQIMGSYLHELIPIKLQKKYPDKWRKDIDKDDKDLVYIPDNFYSVEIKTSSSDNGIFGNRSYGQLDNTTGKSKAGFYIAINFEQFNKKKPSVKPQIKKIRFGWLDHSDWIAQQAATGQQSRVSTEARENKMLLIYENK